MITSNEPGYYENGSFGIRIENLMQIVDVDTPFQFANERCVARQKSPSQCNPREGAAGPLENEGGGHVE